MATRRVAASAATTPTPEGAGTAVNDARPLAVVTSLFFMWGFLTCLNDILVPHLRSIFDLNCSRAMLIQLHSSQRTSCFQYPGRDS